ncbi:MAG: L,D-transpeptidase family protein [Gemmatimonadaceae bacterium]
MHPSNPRERQCPRRVLIVILALLAGALSPRASRAAEPADSVRVAIAQALTDSALIAGVPAHRLAHVRRLYADRHDEPLWTADASARDRASTLLDTVANAPAQGLQTDAYPLGTARQAHAAMGSAAPTAAAAARAEVLLTATFVAYAEDLLTGQFDPRSVSPAWHIDPHDVDVDSAITRTLRQAPFAESLARLRPQNANYRALMRELARYRDIVAGGGWQGVPSGPVLRPGDASTAGRLGPLLARLVVEGYAHMAPLQPAVSGATSLGTEAPVRYDFAMAGAIAEYQRRHALTVDSVVGPNTLASLARPAEYRLRQIAANLERHRWLPRTLGERYVLVNVPAFQLSAFDHQEEALTMNVVVGAEYDGRATPVFSDSMTYVVFRPYWNVPGSIAGRELWPHQRRDPGYFDRHGFEVATASWGRYVRQRPGYNNALGYVKFIFPNDFNIYLHDTPAKSLFDRDVRAFSHGCIRVAEPAVLAAWVLGWDLDRARAAMADGSNDNRVDLSRKLPVYIVYFTTYVRDGTLHFANDIYDRDDALVRAARAGAR